MFIAILSLLTITSVMATERAEVTYVCKENPNGDWYGGIEKVITFSNGNSTRILVTSLNSYRLRRQALPLQESCEEVAERLNKQLLEVNGNLNMNGVNVIK